MKEKFALIVVAMMILPLAAAVLANAAYVNTITIQRIEEDTAAIQSLQQGLTQARLFRIKDVNVVLNMSEAGFQVIKAASGLVNILVNPADTCQDGSFNLFSMRKARFALQFLVDREQIVTNIYKGYAIPVVSPWTPLDPDFPYLIGTLAKWQGIITTKGHDYGVQLLEEALQEAGAVKEDGKWKLNGQDVVVKFVIRTEDARKDIGDAIANDLEAIGLTVERLYRDFSGAFEIVYKGDPSACEWHLYTEGWGITGMTKYDYGNYVWFYTAYWGGTPGWGVEGYWNYNNTTMYKIAEKLDTGNYNSTEEFWNLINTGLEMGIKEAVRVFIAATFDFYIAHPDLQGIIPSPKATPWHTFTFLNLQYTTDSVTLSNRYVYSTGWKWNPVGGWQDFYSRPVVEAITWTGVTGRVTDGATGWSPANTVTWSVQRNVGSVPDSAIYYDPYEHKFVTVGEKPLNLTNLTVNAVTFNYKLLGQIKFHDGSTETIADLLAPLYIIFEYAYKADANDTLYESAVASDYATTLATLLAVEIINDTAVRVYTTYSHLDDGYIAQVASIWTNFPLELYAAMDLLWQFGSETVVENQTEHVLNYVFSLDSEDANHTAIHLLSTVQCDQMKNLLLNYKNNPPAWVQQLIDMGLLTLEEWQQRVDNLVAFYDAHGHMVVGNGPFYLDSYDAQNDVAVLKRVDAFPVSPAAVASELQKKKVEITVDIPSIAYNTSGTIIANVTVTVNGQPATENDVELYVILLDTNTFKSMFLNLTYQGNGLFQATLPTNVAVGTYKVIAIAYPIGYSEPDMKEQTVAVVAPQPEQPEQPENTTQSPGTTTPPAEQPPAETQTEEGGIGTGVIAAAVIIVIIIIGAAYYYLRKG